MSMTPLLDATTIETLATIGVPAVFALGFLAVVVLVIAAVFSILFSRIDVGMKVVWFIFVIIAPVIGALLWFFIGRNQTPVRQW
ncbi:PLD nuclease N-terminal domain-containing protein [Nocardiopsis sp. MG754419]|uniref:PLD nuclease N-terminal domain-containing protein n=1 Tax=Nocardiopsis sp. MG754419 TaxID=2259865 RepID=UPI001BA563A6|nr:PLD nuclease N-terminal domain-containing protein [Nocardiopsis sp. MG754419]MBR8743022.1 hypothetical protein [Nocardiopsis sp. MG754419]